MTITNTELRRLFLDFWQSKNHQIIPPAPLVLQNDPTTLFTSSGMQPLVPYLAGEKHPLGKRLVDIQPSLRTQDIEEVGDNRHTTFFEMMGNWSLGDYFKKEQLAWYFEFLTVVLKLPKEKLYVTVFEGNELIPRDEESEIIWKTLGIRENHIFYYGAGKNWWSRSGPPDKMPPGEIGGPDSEVFYDFDTPHDPQFGTKCHPNCDCGRFMEIGNSVFIQYKKNEDGTLVELPQKNVDFGGGLERMLAAINNQPDIFKTDVFDLIIKAIEKVSGKSYEDENNKSAMRIIADHIKAATFLIKDGVVSSNKGQGYVLRRLLRKSSIQLRSLNQNYSYTAFSFIARHVCSTYKGVYFQDNDYINITNVIDQEMQKFEKTLGHGVKEIQKINKVDGKIAFDLYQSLGLPLEIIEELARQKGQEINHEEFEKEFNKHKELSRKASSGMFKGGLADQGQQTIKYHTATHLIHQALFDILGNSVRQEGSNITNERLRFDFYSTQKPEHPQINKVEIIVNEKINESLLVKFKIMPKEEALKIGAKSFFKEKYPDQVKVYFIGDYSKEFCGGPHVANTREIGKITIYKFEKIGANLYRIYAR